MKEAVWLLSWSGQPISGWQAHIMFLLEITNGVRKIHQIRVPHSIFKNSRYFSAWSLIFPPKVIIVDETKKCKSLETLACKWCNFHGKPFTNLKSLSVPSFSLFFIPLKEGHLLLWFKSKYFGFLFCTDNIWT